MKNSLSILDLSRTSYQNLLCELIFGLENNVGDIRIL